METRNYHEKNKELRLSIEELYHENRPSRTGQRESVSPKSLHRIDFETIKRNNVMYYVQIYGILFVVLVVFLVFRVAVHPHAMINI